MQGSLCIFVTGLHSKSSTVLYVESPTVLYLSNKNFSYLSNEREREREQAIQPRFIAAKNSTESRHDTFLYCSFLFLAESHTCQGARTSQQLAPQN